MDRVSLLKANSYQDGLQTKLIALLKPLGGFEAFFKRGDKVLLKPNFILARSVETAATTHPAMISALAVILKDLGCEVAVGDSPGIGSSRAVLRQLNLLDELQHLGVKIVELETEANQLERFPFINIERRFKNLRLAAELNQFDKIINLPKLKTHGQMGLTLATKNLFGCVAGPAKPQWHYTIGKDYEDFARLIVEIALTVNPTLHILDGIIGMDQNGPANGRPRNLNILLAGTNPLALDRVVVELVQKKPEQFPIFKAAESLGVPGVDLKEIEIKGEPLDSCRINGFEIPSVLPLGRMFHEHATISAVIQSLLRAKLVMDHNRCTRCRRCEMQCPAHAISLKKNKITIDEKECIKCCCCQELCPEGALAVKDPFFIRILKSIW